MSKNIHNRYAPVKHLLVSVVMPVFNRKTLIPETVQSIISQEYDSWELLLVDDGSDNDTLALLGHYAQGDNRIRIIERNRLPKGAQTCRNLGLENAKGELVIFMDSDDLLETFCLEQRVKYMVDNSQHDFAIFPGLIFHKEKYDRNILISDCESEDIIPKLLTLTPPCVPGNNIWKHASLIEKKIYWDENVKAFQDIDFHLLAAYNNLLFTYSDAPPDFFWRKHDEGNTGSELSETNKLASHQYFFKKHVDILREKHLYEHYSNEINSLAGQLILISFRSGKKENAENMIDFIKNFGLPFSKMGSNILLKLYSIYNSGGIFRVLARLKLRLIYPSVFPLFKNKTFAKIPWNPDRR